jgi:hypothetical protein
MELFDLEYDKVKPIQNYTQWDKREISIENLALDLLHHTVRTAEQFLSQIEEKDKISDEEGLFSNCTIS